ncbi:MAG TPA: hypothetical protein VGQ86_02405 [Candidatus Limnocylindria bacterium]|jgi:hypothetical protein|nr:hypothetical protein [Candidatus Limnocylindria bacterium]
MACGSFEGPRALGPTPSATPLKLPQPIAQPITRTSSAAQTAWLWSSSQSQDRARSLIGVNPSGQIVGQLDEAALAGATGVWRSANGATLFIGRESLIAAHSAVDGKLQRVYKSKPTGSTVASAVSPDGRWLALLSAGPDPRVQVIDLTADVAQALPVVHDPNAKLPGLTGGTAATVWGTVAFGPDSTSLYALTDWGGPARVTAFTLAGDRLAQTGTAVDAQSGRRFPSCAGPAAAASVSALAKALVIFCHVDGAIWFFDLNALGNVTVVQADQPNPFWLSPIFTPDGQLLYLHQWPGFGDKMQVVELSSRRMLGPVPTPTKVGDPGPFSWRMPIAYAGGTASTVPISPDGLKLYSGTANGVIVLRVPDLKPLAKLAPGLNVNEVWVSGDGRTLYATAENGKGLFVIREDGSAVIPVSTPTILGGFISTERG